MVNLYPIKKRVQEDDNSDLDSKLIPAKESEHLNPSLSPITKHKRDSSNSAGFEGRGKEAKDWIWYLMDRYGLSLRTLSIFAGYKDDIGFEIFIDIITNCSYNAKVFHIPKRKIQIRVNLIDYFARLKKGG